MRRPLCLRRWTAIDADMGVVVSTNSTLAPISLASTIIGFVSFAFTLATFFRIVWTNLETFGEPQHAVHTYLTTLREELLEERASLRSLKKHQRLRRKNVKKLPNGLRELLALELDEVTIKTMQDSVRHLIKQFEGLEKPFLKDNLDGIQQSRRRSRSRRRADMSPSPHYEHSAYASPPRAEKRTRSEEREGDRQADDDLYWAQRVQYAPYDFKRRFIWLYNKSSAQDLFATLTRLQTRRIAQQVNIISVLMGEMGHRMFESHDAVNRIDERLNRFVGARRVD